MQMQSWYHGCNECYNEIHILRQEHKQIQEIKLKACVMAHFKFCRRCKACKQQMLCDVQ